MAAVRLAGVPDRCRERLGAPAASATSRIASNSAGVSVGKAFIATTTGTP